MAHLKIMDDESDKGKNNTQALRIPRRKKRLAR
jgi:hypothetical protein